MLSLLVSTSAILNSASYNSAALQVDGVLTDGEAASFVQAAEKVGLQHQGSRGSAYGEVI